MIRMLDPDTATGFPDDPDWTSLGRSFDETKEKPDGFQNLHYAADDFLSFIAGLEHSAE